jgi:hypothetical protein
MDDAPRRPAGEQVGDRRGPVGRVEGLAVNLRDLRLGCEEMGGSDLNGGGAQRESGGDAASIGNAASGDDRDRDRIESFGPTQRRSTARG